MLQITPYCSYVCHIHPTLCIGKLKLAHEFKLVCFVHELHICTCIVLCATGHQTKALLNNSGPKVKRSKLERDINVEVVFQLVFVITIALVGAIGTFYSKYMYMYSL